MFKILGFLAVLLAFTLAIDIKLYIDYWCSHYNNDVKNNTLKLPPLRLGESFFKYEFEDGRLGDLSTLWRTGPCDLVIQNGTAVSTLNVGLRRLWVAYKKCQVINPLFSTEARINATYSADNAVRLVIGIDYGTDKESCTLRLLDSKIERLEIDNVSVQGFGFLNSLFSWISKKILLSHQDEFNGFFDLHLQRYLKKTFQDFDLCDKIKLLMEGTESS